MVHLHKIISCLSNQKKNIPINIKCLKILIAIFKWMLHTFPVYEVYFGALNNK